MSDAVAIRRWSPDEHEALAALAHRAFRFGDGSGWGPYFKENAHVLGGDVVVAEVDGERAGAAVSLNLTLTLRGVELPMGGVAAVSVAPEFRRAGVAQEMLRALLHEMPARGQCVAGLHAVSLAFYRRVGFGLVESVEEVRARPAHFISPAGAAGAVRPMVLARDLDAVTACYDRWRRARSGPLARSEYWWRERVLRGGVEGVVLRERDAVTGYALFTIPQDPPYPLQHLRVLELVAETPEAWGALLRWIRALDDQYRLVSVDVPAGMSRALRGDHGIPDAPDHWLERDLGAVSITGMMARITDLPTALAAQGRAGAAVSFGLDVTDPVARCDGAWDVRVSPAGVTAARGADCAERLALRIDALTQVWAGSARAKSLQDMGFATGSPVAAARLDDAFPETSFFLGARNYF